MNKAVVPISVCICTMDRPAELTRCLKSILESSVLPAEIVVSDDSRGDATRTLCLSYPLVRYIEGPRRGQGPNRQAGALACRSPFVSFVDDDAMVGHDFLAIMGRHTSQADGQTIMAGRLLEKGQLFSPTNLTFWGHFGGKVLGVHQTVIFSSNLFPRSVFDMISFEPRIKYGYEDSDFCTQALAIGYRIELVPDAINEHLPSSINRSKSQTQAEYARYYTSLKRYFSVQRRPGAGMLFMALAPWQAIAAAARRRNWTALRATPGDFIRALTDYLIDCRSARTKVD